MELRKFLLGGISAALMMTGASGMAQAATDDLNIDAVIVAAVTIDCSVGDNLNFGTASAPTGGPDTIRIDINDGRTIPDSDNGLAVIGAGATSGDCAITASNGQTVQVTLPASTTVISGGDNMTVNNFTLGTIDGPGVSGVTFVATGGADALTIGGDLIVGDGQAAGTYAGTVTITANYN